MSLDNAACDACTGCQCQPGSEPTSDGTCLLVSITFCTSLFMCMLHALINPQCVCAARVTVYTLRTGLIAGTNKCDFRDHKSNRIS